MNLVFPNYEKCLTNMTNSILKFFGVNCFHDTLNVLDGILEKNNPKNVVLILYDGMGSNLMKRNLNKESFLNKYKLMDIQSVFPSTTVAATTSVLSGKNPVEHGWLGWDMYFKEVNNCVSMFENTIKDTDILASEENLANKYYSYTSIIDLINKTSAKAWALYPFGAESYRDLKDMNQRIIDLCRNDDKNFIYAYAIEPDCLMHQCGTEADEVVNMFLEINNSTEELCNNLKDTVVIVVADHGHINSDFIILSDYPDIIELLEHDIAIESRACSFKVKSDKLGVFRKLFEKYFKDDFILYSKDELINNKLFGLGNEHERFRESIGDFVAVAKNDKCFRYDNNGPIFKSNHAGMTEDEMIVPLIVFESE